MCCYVATIKGYISLEIYTIGPTFRRLCFTCGTFSYRYTFLWTGSVENVLFLLDIEKIKKKTWERIFKEQSVLLPNSLQHWLKWQKQWSTDAQLLVLTTKSRKASRFLIFSLIIHYAIISQSIYTSNTLKYILEYC